MLDIIVPLVDKGMSINQIARHLKTYDVKIRRIVKESPDIEKRLFENGVKRKTKGSGKGNVYEQ